MYIIHLFKNLCQIFFAGYFRGFDKVAGMDPAILITGATTQVGVVAKALVRLLRSHYEVQAIVLNSIAAMTIQATRTNKLLLLVGMHLSRFLLWTPCHICYWYFVTFSHKELLFPKIIKAKVPFKN